MTEQEQLQKIIELRRHHDGVKFKLPADFRSITFNANGDTYTVQIEKSSDLTSGNIRAALATVLEEFDKGLPDHKDVNI